MPKPAKHVFVCMQGRPPGHPRGSCAGNGCNEIFEEFMFQWQSRDLITRGVQVTGCGCLGPCTAGPNVLVYPEGVMYGAVKKEDVARIVDGHLLGGEPVGELLMDAELWG